MTPATPVVVAWSGGKDSAWMLHALQRDACWSVQGLLTSVDAADGHVAVHRLPAGFLQAQARALALPLLRMPLPAQPDNARYEAAFAEALTQLRQYRSDLAHIAFGDIFLADVRAWREALCARLGWTAVFPLWQNDTTDLAHAMLDAGLDAALCCIDTSQLDPRFIDHRFDRMLLDALPAHVDPCGERGEFHTAVFDGPMFRHPVARHPRPRVVRESRFIYALPEALESDDNNNEGDVAWPVTT